GLSAHQGVAGEGHARCPAGSAGGPRAPLAGLSKSARERDQLPEQRAALRPYSMDFFTVPTATFPGLFVFLVLSHDRRRILHWNITEHPTEQWTVQQLREAFPWDEAPRYLIRDRDAIFGREIGATIKGMGAEAVVTAARSPWQNPFVERLIGSILRECLDHVIVWNESSLQRVLQNYFEYYERSRTHLALNKDAPVSRPVEGPANGRIVEVSQVGGLHHRYQRCAA